ncbi:MAG: iron ABC transporter permease [Candidatus Lambdaproteobacteria bacterium]|nr:iron ABC transporter permease [Candidatus Lambdaproteobacteria bacterium]
MDTQPSLPLAPAWSWRLPRPHAWGVVALLVALLVASPLLAVLGIALHPEDDIWAHLVSTVLAGYVATTVLLALGVGAGVLVIGVGTAWLITMCTFPGRRLFSWALLLPLAMPTYLAAYAYTELLEYAGPLQALLRQTFGWQTKSAYWFPEIRSLGGAMTFMTLVLYPYVYLLARAAFLAQSASLLEVGRSLGRGPWRCFFTLALPLARPAIVVGLALALMETLNDFGTVDFFAVQTFTVGIYRVWFGMNNAPGAAQLATLLMAFVLLLVALERLARQRQRYHHTSARVQSAPLFRLRGAAAGGALLACALPIALGFAVPAGLLASYALDVRPGPGSAALPSTVGNSLGVSLLAALACVGVGTLLAYAVRLRPTAFVHAASRVASVGYAVPGSVLAVGVMIPAARLDNALDALLRQTLGISTGLLLSGTVAALVFAYTARFLALGFGTMEAGLVKITPNMDHAARSLGCTAGRVLRRVHVPLLRGSLLTAGLLVFVDAMKELPMTLILRPFNFTTLATHVYEYASAERFRLAAPAALAIVASGLIPVILLSRGIAQSRVERVPQAGLTESNQEAIPLRDSLHK